jgi:membrane-associated protease RseP (regulator of RpoE activity)
MDSNLYIYLFIIVFFLGTFILKKTKFKNILFFVFMIKTKKGIGLLDKLASLSKGFWKFFADFAVVVSFGGFGAYYISKFRRIEPILFIIGIACIFLYGRFLNFFSGILVFVLLIVSLLLLSKVGGRKLSFIFATFLIFMIMLSFFQNPFAFEGLRTVTSLATSILGIPAFLIMTLLTHGIEIILQKSTIPGVSPLLPSVVRGQVGFSFPGTEIFIPFWHALVAIIILLVFHEFLHGVLSRVHNIRISSIGVLTVGPMPIGAFVEPDENVFQKRPGIQKMRVFAVGSFTNLIISIVAILMLTMVVTPLYSQITKPDGIKIVGLMEGYPAYDVLAEGMIIYRINGEGVETYEKFSKVMSKIIPNETLTLETDKGTFSLVTVEHPENSSRGYIGISLEPNFKVKEHVREKYGFFADSFIYWSPVFFWIWFLNFNIALVNLLPVKPFDGGGMFEELLKSFNLKESTKRKIVKVVIYIFLAVLLVNALPHLQQLFKII